VFDWNFYLAKHFLIYRHPYLAQFLTKLGDFNSHGCTHKLFTTFFVLKYPMTWRFGFSNFKVLMYLPTSLSTLCHYSSMDKFANAIIDRFWVLTKIPFTKRTCVIFDMSLWHITIDVTLWLRTLIEHIELYFH
jgi:hypothetical protein